MAAVLDTRLRQAQTEKMAPIDLISAGPPGTGKSHLAQAIGRAAIMQGFRVGYREAHTLLEELAEATLAGTRST